MQHKDVQYLEVSLSAGLLKHLGLRGLKHLEARGLLLLGLRGLKRLGRLFLELSGLDLSAGNIESMFRLAPLLHHLVKELLSAGVTILV